MKGNFKAARVVPVDGSKWEFRLIISNDSSYSAYNEVSISTEKFTEIVSQFRLKNSESDYEIVGGKYYYYYYR